MNRLLKILAIAALVITIIGAGAVLYGMTMFEPRVESVSAAATPAVQVQEILDAALTQVESGAFAGRQFAPIQGLSAQDCTFLTYTVRLANRGFFPAEWITMEVEPVQSESGAGYDVLQLAHERPQVLVANSQGDLSATILRAGDAGDTARHLKIICYVFGRRVEIGAQAM